MRSRFAIRTDLQAMAADERQLEDRLTVLHAREARAKVLIESTWRATHVVKEPEQMVAWREPRPAQPRYS